MKTLIWTPFMHFVRYLWLKCCPLSLHVELVISSFIVCTVNWFVQLQCRFGGTLLENISPLLVYSSCLSATFPSWQHQQQPITTKAHPTHPGTNCLLDTKPSYVAYIFKKRLMWIIGWHIFIFMVPFNCFSVHPPPHLTQSLYCPCSVICSLPLHPTPCQWVSFLSSCTCQCSALLTEKGVQMLWCIHLESKNNVLWWKFRWSKFPLKTLLYWFVIYLLAHSMPNQLNSVGL